MVVHRGDVGHFVQHARNTFCDHCFTIGNSSIHDDLLKYFGHIADKICFRLYDVLLKGSNSERNKISTGFPISANNNPDTPTLGTLAKK